MSRRVSCLAALLTLASCGAPAGGVSPMTASATLAQLVRAVPTVLVAEPCRVVDARANVRCTRLSTLTGPGVTKVFGPTSWSSVRGRFPG